jgi:signal transduction histidine kinase
MFPRLTILQKGLILIAVPLLFQVLFLALLAKMRSDGVRAVDWTIHSKEVLSQAQLSRVQVLRAHGAIQGFILTHDPIFEAALQRAISQSLEDLDTLKGLVVDREDQTQAASKIRYAASNFLAFMEEGRAMVKVGRMDVATAASRRLHSQGLLDALDAHYERFIDFEKGLDRERQEQMYRSRNSLLGGLLGGFAASLIFTIVLAILFSRNISGRIGNLTENSHRLAEGKELTPPISGGDEIARLDRVFHEMATTLSDSARRERHHSRLLERRAEELDAINAQLREKAQENEMFVYSVSHDLRSPLVNLQGFGKELGMLGKDLLRLVDQEQVPPETRRQARVLIESEMGESIGFIQTAVTRLSGIIDGLLRLSRAGQVEYRRQEVQLGPVVARVVAALRGTIDRRQATVKVGDLPPAWGDPTAIEQVFANLIGNAINYLDKDRPGKIEVVAVDPLEVGGPPDGIARGSVVYAVRDNGMGISESYKSKVFAVFQRLHGDVAKGEGVGLALVRRMVERHGGRVWFESKPGQGTTFFVALPSAEAQTLSDVKESTDERDVVSSLVSPETENGRSN